MSQEWIRVQGAREHNLKNVSVKLPRNKLTVITGLSGSGKSSLAFDTLYAEGQRRYVESLSAYARQFLNQMQKPDVEMIEGLSPAISIEQRVGGSNPRSIVATTTEIHDYLRLLFANIGIPHCPKCGERITRQSPEEIVNQLSDFPEKTRLIVMAPLVSGRKGEHEDVFQRVRKDGFVRVRVDGEVLDLEDVPKLNKKQKHSIDVVVDRLMVNSKVRSRLTDSVELALKHGEGTLSVLIQADAKSEPSETFYSEHHACLSCNLSFEDLSPRHFSFNSPYGACPDCAGIGSRLAIDEALVVPDASLSLEDGAIQAWRRGGRRMILYYRHLLKNVAKYFGIPMDVPFEDLPKKTRDLLLHGSGDEVVSFTFRRGGKQHRYEKPFEGVIPSLERRYAESDSDYTRQRLRGYMTRGHCHSCDGARLKPVSRACTVGGISIVDFTRMSVIHASAFINDVDLSEQEQHIAGEVLKEIRVRLSFMKDVGLGYLTLDRESGTLSGGEAQRIRLATQIGSGLVGVMYVLDEPSIGLHHRDNQRLIHTLQHLRDVGNSVIVVEHDEDTIRCADYVIDLGPGAGSHGGEIVFQGTSKALLKDKRSATAAYLTGRDGIPLPEKRLKPKGFISVVGAAENNLKNATIKLPLGVLACVTGVSGSGKSTYMDTILRRALFRKFYGSTDRPGKHKRITGLDKIDKVIVIDQSPIGRTPRSNPATYTGAFGDIRNLFAELPASKVRGYQPGRYSFNVKGGRCEVCKGDGQLKLEMHFLPDVYVPCEQCAGRRYNRETLEIRYSGLNIAEVLDLTIDDALAFFENIPAIARKLRTLSEVGLGYLQLGQSATTLSGGEAQRVKLSSELSKRPKGHTLYLLDEPTTGLHFADIRRLLEVLQRLRDAGNSVAVIEHNLDVIKTADYIVDLGPDGGDAGGEVVATGTPEEVAACDRSFTGQALKDVL